MYYTAILLGVLIGALIYVAFMLLFVMWIRRDD